MFDYASYIFWAYILVLVPMLLTVFFLFHAGDQIKKNIRKL